MKRFSTIFLVATVVVLLLWQIPWWTNFLTARTSKVPFTLYSSVLGDFISTERIDEKSIVRHDRAGNVFTQEEVDSLLPFFHMRQLVADGRFPEQVCGVDVTPHEVQRTSFSFRISPSDINATAAGLYPLLESMSGRVDLAMPDDVFRITGSGVEFIRMDDNAIDAGKSRNFTDALLRKGFRFPARSVAGNPTARKEYDEGYLLTDADGRLFHLKQQCGRPYVRAIELPEGCDIRHMFVTEFRDRSLLGFLVDAEGRFIVLRRSYELIPAQLPPFDPATEGMTIIGNMLDWTVCTRTASADRYTALRADDMTAIDSVEFPVDRRPMPGLYFTSPDDKFVRPRLIF
ncbi:MAG: DUF4857 domain-containing protein [Alistipes sp.]|nr:DUF4857 domain-containing protein [Alistipes sp.]